MNETNLPATRNPDLPDWFFEDEAEGAVDRYGGATGGEGGGLPFLGFAAKDTGSRGGSVTWADLRDVGCAEGDLYAFGGALGRPVRLANVPLLLVRSLRVAYMVDDTANWKPIGTRVIDGHADAQAGEKEAFEALILALAPEPFLGSFRDRLNKGEKVFSRVVGPWADRVRAATLPKGLPRWAAVCARLRAENATASSGRVYHKQILQLGELTAADLARLSAWVASEDGRESQEAVDAWERRYLEPGAAAAEEADPTAGWK